MQVVLKLLSDSKTAKQIVLPSSDCILGRGEDCGLRLNSQHVSRRHCQIKLEAGHAWVSDLNSRNGTLINEERIDKQQRLHPGDILKVGNFKFELKLIDEIDGSSADSRVASWSDFCRAINEIDAPNTSCSEPATLKTVDIPAPTEVKPDDPGATRQLPAGAALSPPQADSRTAAQDALRRYFSGR